MKSRQVFLAAVAGAAVLLAWWMLSVGVKALISPPPEQRPPASTETGARRAATSLGASESRRIEPMLLKQILESDPGTQHRVIIELASRADLGSVPSSLSRAERRIEAVRRLRATASDTQVDLLAFLQAGYLQGHVQQVHPFWVFNGIAVIADGDTVLDLTDRPEVHLIRSDRWQLWLDPTRPQTTEAGLQTDAGSAEWNISKIQADVAWENLKLDGSGVTVAIMDTGVDWQHPILQAQYRGYRPGGPFIHEGNWLCTTDEGYLYPVDGHGHGTHVAGLAVGGRDSQGTAVGVAPGARWIAVKMLSDNGFGYDSWIHAAFEWLLAPAGDPALAPDVVNGSWGSALSGDETFRADLQAIRTAGIVPVFSAGNGGPQPASLESPGSYPEVIAVGATDDIDEVASFSSRGPSPWGETKPEVCAPGAQIRSSLPGGTYGVYSGTSMAAPHVAGSVALLLQADVALTLDQVEGLLTATAKPLDQPAPGNTCGWGRINAYLAAATALEAGYVTGQVTSQAGQVPISETRITAFDHEGQQVAMTRSDQQGAYFVAMPAGQYDLEFEAFGYVPQAVPNVVVQAFVTTTLDVSLASLPSGILWGYVSGAGDGTPVSARLSIVDTPAHTSSDPITGFYSFALPAGTYALQGERNGYRRLHVPDIQISVDQYTQLDIDLVSAPTLLLVDSGRWYYGSQAAFFEQALEDSEYVFDLWEIRDRSSDVPSAEDLGSYDITIWSAPFDSPGLVGASDVISSYLTTGGRLFLTGQDVGYWDGGLEGSSEEYYVELLRARAVADDAGRDDVIGLPGELMSDLILPMNGPDSAGNQLFPDAIEVAEPRHAALVAEYATGTGACLRAAGCQSYRAFYIAAGLEALGDRASRAEVLGRAIEWLGASPPAVGVDLYPPAQAKVWLQERIITYTVEILNSGLYTDRLSLELSGASWPTEIWDSGLVQPITRTAFLGACQTQTVGLRVTVPAEVHWNATDAVTLTARSQLDPSVEASASFRSKAPAPILLVDDHRWYSTLDTYQSALDANNLPYDVWSTDPTTPANIASVSLARLKRYPIVIWFTAYDWYSTLTQADEQHLARYLDSGGRLLFSSQDYLFTNGLTGLAAHYLGVVGYTESLTATRVVGAVGNPAGIGSGPYSLEYPFRNWSDALQYSHQAQPLLWGQHGQPVALSMRLAPWKSAFLAFPLEAFSVTDRRDQLGQLTAWLSPLGDSSMSADRRVVAQGDEVKYTLTVRNSGPADLSTVAMSNTVPLSTTYVTGSLQGPAVYDPEANRFSWSGPLGSGESITIGYRLELDSPLSDGTAVSNIMHLRDESGLGVDRLATVLVDAPDLSASVMQVSSAFAGPKQSLTYSILLRNDGLCSAPAGLDDPVPVWTTFAPGTGWASSGDLETTTEGLSWAGTISPGGSVTITFSVVISPSTNDLYVLNWASLYDGFGSLYPLHALSWVEGRTYLPLVYNHP